MTHMTAPCGCSLDIRPGAERIHRPGCTGQPPIAWTYDDGGRAAAGFRGDAGDCVTRAIAIAVELPYRDVYDALAVHEANAGRARSARNGVARPIIRAFLDELGWDWTPTMAIGSGCTVHLRTDELPSGRVIASLSKHLCAVVDGVIRDTHDPSRAGTRCVYGYWTPGAL